MPGTPHKPIHKSASPRRTFFDPWNTASTGHQRAENRLAGSTSWRKSRAKKLHAQFSAGLSGGERISDTVGAGSEDFGRDGRTETGWEESVLGWRGRSGVGKDQGDIGSWASRANTGNKASNGGAAEKGNIEGDSMGKRKKRINLSHERDTEARQSILIQGNELDSTSHNENYFPPPSAQPLRSPSPLLPEEPPPPFGVPKRSKRGPAANTSIPAASTSANGSNISGPVSKIEPAQPEKPPQIFSQLTIFINGSTMPHISDHKLKHLLTSHGAQMSLGLARKEVTHVILGRPNIGSRVEATAGLGHLRGAGGGLAGGKLQKEVLSTGQGAGKGAKYVGVEWVLESIKAGKRLPESRFPGVSTAPAGVKSVRSFFIKQGE